MSSRRRLPSLLKVSNACVGRMLFVVSFNQLKLSCLFPAIAFPACLKPLMRV